MPRLDRTLCRLVCFVALLGLLSPAMAQRHDRLESPFSAIRWQGVQPEVLVNGEWNRPLFIHGVDVRAILGFCERQWPGRAQKRFGEDLVEAMTLMGREPPAHVDLVLERLSDCGRVTIVGVAMSAANRRAIYQANQAAAETLLLTREQAIEDVRELGARLEDRFAYLTLNGTDWRVELADLEEQLPVQITPTDLALRLEVFMATFGDGHAAVESPTPTRPTAYPPFVTADSAHGVVALRPDRSGFVNPERPVLIAIDGRPIDEWLAALSRRIPAGSPQFVRDRAVRRLVLLALVRPELGIAETPTVSCTLAASDAGDDARTIELAMVADAPESLDWPDGSSRVLESGIGYVRMAAMEEELVPQVRQSMAQFRDTPGLIVDVRGNGGGSRDILIALAGYLIGPGEKPWVANAARYILSDAFEADHLEQRFMSPADHPGWSARQREAIAAFAPGFTPEWEPAEREFSAWHYIVLDRTGHEDEYHYDKRVVVLSDGGCFSATDIFLGAMAGRPRITLMGGASGGGSALRQWFTLSHSRIEIGCASMVSYRPDGRLYDTRGVEVDVEVPVLPTDLIRGGTDSALEAAERWLLSEPGRTR